MGTGVISLLSVRSKRSANESCDEHESRDYRDNGHYYQDEPLNVSNHASCSERRIQPTSASAAAVHGFAFSACGRHRETGGRASEPSDVPPFPRAVQSTLRRTPAMAAGVTDRLWLAEDLIAEVRV